MTKGKFARADQIIAAANERNAAKKAASDDNEAAKAAREATKAQAVIDKAAAVATKVESRAAKVADAQRRKEGKKCRGGCRKCYGKGTGWSLCPCKEYYWCRKCLEDDSSRQFNSHKRKCSVRPYRREPVPKAMSPVALGKRRRADKGRKSVKHHRL